MSIPDTWHLGAWQNFYMLIGSAAAALVGIQFVVITLIASIRGRTDAKAIDAFGTPTIVHLSAALLISAIIIAPWRVEACLCATLGVIGVLGIIYCILVARRARRQTDYKPVWEDWVWHTLLPLLTYITLLLAAWFLCTAPDYALFAIAAASLGLLLIGIHNAWDTVIHVVVNKLDKNQD